MEQSSHQRLLLNYSSARRSWESWCYMNNLHLKVSNSDLKSYCTDNELLSHLRYLALKDIHIELYKIIKDKDRTCADNIFKCLRKFEGQDANVSKHLELSGDLKLSIDSILNVRDKFYAHLDADYKFYLDPKFKVQSYYDVFVYIEQGIKLLGLNKEFEVTLSQIPSRDDFELDLKYQNV